MKTFLNWLGIMASSLALIYLAYLAIMFGSIKLTGINDWKQVQHDLRAKGEKLTFAELVPRPPRDRDNFFADALWQQLNDLVLHSENGKTKWIPKLAKKDQLINQWDSPLTEVELARIKVSYPEENLSKSFSRKDAIKRLAISLKKSNGTDEEKIAQLIFDLEKPASPLLSRTANLLERTFSYFPIRYQDNFYTALPHCAPLLTIGQLLGAKASSELVLGQIDAASTDIQALLKLARVADNEPVLTCMLVGKAILKIGIEPLDKGISRHLWNDRQLKFFQHYLQVVNFIGALPQVLRGERACVDAASLIDIAKIDGLESDTALIVKAGQFFLQEHEKAFYDEWIQQFIDLLNSRNSLGINATSIPDIVTDEPNPKDLSKRIQSMKKIAVLLLSQTVIRGALQTTVETQTQVSQTLIACGLERYYLAHGAYPTSLDSLIPDFLERLPKAPTTGQAMLYRLTDTQHFQLWAPGWNLHSLGGKLGAYRGDGDIVWNQPLPTGERPIPKDP